MTIKIDRVKLNQLLRAGKPQKEIAKFFGVTEGAVSKAKRELKLSVIRSVVVERAHEVIDENLNTVQQLQRINREANRIIDELSKSSDRADRELILKACREVQSQLRLQLEIFQTMYDVRLVADFQREVLEVINNADPESKNRIVEALNKRRLVGPSFSVS